MLLNKHIDKESIENLYESSNILASRYNTVSQKLAIKELIIMNLKVHLVRVKF